MGIYTYNTKVDISDVGENNLLTNRGILKFMQEASALHSHSIGYGLNDTPTTHLVWIILNWKLKVYKRPIWNTNLHIQTWSRPIKKLYCYRDLKIYDDDDNLIAVASSKWILLDVKTHSIARPPEGMNSKYESLDKLVFDVPMNEKLKEPTNSEITFDYIVQRRDVDTNHHVNNLYYLDYAYEALPNDIYLHSDFMNVEIMYKHESKLGNNIIGLYSKNENNEHIITLKDKESSLLHAIVKLY